MFSKLAIFVAFLTLAIQASHQCLGDGRCDRVPAVASEVPFNCLSCNAQMLGVECGGGSSQSDTFWCMYDCTSNGVVAAGTTYDAPALPTALASDNTWYSETYSATAVCPGVKDANCKTNKICSIKDMDTGATFVDDPNRRWNQAAATDGSSAEI